MELLNEISVERSRPNACNTFQTVGWAESNCLYYIMCNVQTGFMTFEYGPTPQTVRVTGEECARRETRRECVSEIQKK